MNIMWRKTPINGTDFGILDGKAKGGSVVVGSGEDFVMEEMVEWHVHLWMLEFARTQEKTKQKNPKTYVQLIKGAFRSVPDL